MSTTLSTPISAIPAAGGPGYSYTQINPANVADGGETGGNIRQLFLCNSSRVGFTSRGSATAGGAADVQPGPDRARQLGVGGLVDTDRRLNSRASHEVV
ncbi:hypothetical protein ABTY98_31960 [Streptomyces sp. NPDC096040]|uniref:hypothetical protein n=1 Tax=Streptomyces sp. NPDC096040 TaxID=3155541 RepID=UPI003321E746